MGMPVDHAWIVVFAQQVRNCIQIDVHNIVVFMFFVIFATCTQLRNEGLALYQRLIKELLLPGGVMYLFTEILIINIVSA